MLSLTKAASASALTVVVALGLGGLRPAAAQEAIRGQGATLPAGLYPAWFAPTPVKNFSFSYNAARNGVASTTGSGAGKAAFESHSFNNLGQDLDLQFAGSDAILGAADIDTYNTARWGDPIQVPSVGTSVTISYNATGLRRTRTGPTGVPTSTGAQNVGPIVYLSRKSYCGIFTGKITVWNDASIVADNGVAPSTAQIKVVVRSDGSGTTEIFTRHLDTVCDGSAAAGGYSFPDTRKAADQSNTLVPPPGRTGGASATGDNVVNWAALIKPASRLIQAAGNGGVSTAIAANRYAIGYLSPDYTNLVSTPATGSGSPLPVPANLQNQADITAGTVSYAHSPSWKNVQTAQSALATPLATDSALVWGQKLHLRQGGRTPTAVDPRNNPTAATAYPITGFTFLDFYTCYPSDKTAGVRGLITYFTTTSAVAGSADAEAKAAGFSPLPSRIKNGIRARALATGSSPRGVSSGPISGTCSL